MKIHLFFILLSLIVSEGFSQANKDNQALSTVYHYRNNAFLRNFDGTRSRIDVNWNTVTLTNPDGSQSSIEICGGMAILNALDGSISTVIGNGLSSTVFNADGTKIIVNHRRTSSFCSTGYGKHTIMHTFGSTDEWPYKKIIDILIHMNWSMQTRPQGIEVALN